MIPEKESTYDWLRGLGAIRPMAVASEEVLVLGEFHEGFYPIMWNRYRDEVTRDFNGHRVNQAPIEEWYVHGIPSMLPLTKEDVVRILRASN